MCIEIAIALSAGKRNYCLNATVQSLLNLTKRHALSTFRMPVQINDVF